MTSFWHSSFYNPKKSHFCLFWWSSKTINSRSGNSGWSFIDLHEMISLIYNDKIPQHWSCLYRECAKFCGSHATVGLVPWCNHTFVGPKFSLVGILWVRNFSSVYFVGPKFSLVGISWVQNFSRRCFIPAWITSSVMLCPYTQKYLHF